jgi:hypothetical protein
MFIGTIAANLESGMDSRGIVEVEMTTSEKKLLWRGVAAGTIMGLALGLIIALFIALRPELFRALIS